MINLNRGFPSKLTELKKKVDSSLNNYDLTIKIQMHKNKFILYSINKTKYSTKNKLFTLKDIT